MPCFSCADPAEWWVHPWYAPPPSSANGRPCNFTGGPGTGDANKAAHKPLLGEEGGNDLPVLEGDRQEKSMTSICWAPRHTCHKPFILPPPPLPFHYYQAIINFCSCLSQ